MQKPEQSTTELADEVNAKSWFFGLLILAVPALLFGAFFYRTNPMLCGGLMCGVAALVAVALFIAKRANKQYESLLCIVRQEKKEPCIIHLVFVKGQNDDSYMNFTRLECESGEVWVKLNNSEPRVKAAFKRQEQSFSGGLKQTKGVSFPAIINMDGVELVGTIETIQSNSAN